MKQTSPTELSTTVDIPALKDLMKEAGCVIHEGFEIELEKYLRILMTRYIPRESKKSYASTRQMGKAMKSLFTGEMFSAGSGCLITEDKNAIRIWDREFFDRKKGVSLGLPQHLREHLPRTAEMRSKASFTIEPKEITELIPRAIQHMQGNHKYITFVFGRKNPTIFNSKTQATFKSEVSVLTKTLATNLLLAKDQTIEVRLIRRKGNRNLLVSGTQFEIFFK